MKLDEWVEEMKHLSNGLTEKVLDGFLNLQFINAFGLYSEIIFPCQSPIEQLLSLKLHLYIRRNLSINIQEPIIINEKRYVADFLIEGEHNGKTVKVVVECDGHDYHEKTKQQAKRDRSRDRSMQAAGYTVLRFTGSEIWEDAEKCAKEVWNTIQSITGVKMDGVDGNEQWLDKTPS